MTLMRPPRTRARAAADRPRCPPDTWGHTARRPVRGKGSYQPGRTTGTDRRQRPRLLTASRLTGPKDRSFPRVTVGEASLPGAHTCRCERVAMIARTSCTNAS